MLLRCLTSSESEEGSWECSAKIKIQIEQAKRKKEKKDPHFQYAHYISTPTLYSTFSEQPNGSRDGATRGVVQSGAVDGEFGSGLTGFVIQLFDGSDGRLSRRRRLGRRRRRRGTSSRRRVEKRWEGMSRGETTKSRRLD